jgi:hypothetical protein
MLKENRRNKGGNRSKSYRTPQESYQITRPNSVRNRRGEIVIFPGTRNRAGAEAAREEINRNPIPQAGGTINLWINRTQERRPPQLDSTRHLHERAGGRAGDGDLRSPGRGN